MTIKWFDDFEGKYYDVSANVGATLVKGVEGWETTSGYLKLVLLISQTSTNNPTYTELENTTGETYTIQRDLTAGNYYLTFSDNIMSQGKTIIFIQQSDVDVIQAYRYDEAQLNIVTNGDDILYFTSLEVRIYN